jgi:hypothetical protein
LPLAAGAVTLVVVVLTFVFFWTWYAQPAKEPATIHQRIEAGRKALAQGKFRMAASELEAARTMRDRRPELLSPAERRQLTQWHRQAVLLANLSSTSLEEILHHALDLAPDEQEWQRVFAQSYQGKGVIFDAEVRREAARTYRLEYTVFVNDKPAVIDLANVQLLGTLPLDKPQRLLFGVRLAGIRAEAEGTWVVRFEPDSGVLLTDLDAAVAACAQPAEELNEVVQRQAEWMASAP